MTPWGKLNAVKIHDVVYLLLRKYHGTHGLCAIGWIKSPGNCYYSFYCAADRGRDGRPHHLPEVYGRYALAIFQDRIALPAWSAGRPVEHPEWQTRELGLDELLDWYEEQLDLKRLFDDHVDVIASWRRTQEAEPTARYVLVWHIMALLATRHRGRILTYGRSQYEFGLPDHERRAAEALDCAAAAEAVHFCHGLAFCNDARVLLPTARQVDLWPLFLQKRSALEALEHVLQSTLSP